MAVVLYASAAWAVTPGFYDCCAPPTPYAFTCPPPIAGANARPEPGHEVIPVTDGVSEADSPYTNDGQLIIGFLPGSFEVAGRSSVTVDITPLATCPSPPGIKFSTNAYEVTSDAMLVKEATLEMTYSDLTPAPSFVYRADSADGPWTSIGAGSQAQLWTINAKTDRLGYFAAGYPITKSAGGNQLLPAVVAILILLVVAGGVPLTIVRRRVARGDRTDI